MSGLLEHLPIFLQVRQRLALVVGGGLMAARKADLLLRAGANIRLVAPSLHRETAELIAAHAGRAAETPDQHIEYLPEVFAPHHLDGAALAIAATDSRTINEVVAHAAVSLNIPVNVVDDAALSSFIFPAIVDRSPLVVAIGSGGSSPVLARRIRAQIEALLPARLGALARFARRHRAKVQKRLRTELRRPFWERVLAGPIASRVLDGDEVLADAALQRELTSFAGAPRASTGEVYLIGAGPGDPELLTIRAVQLLQLADVILYDRLVSPAVLERARRDAERVFVGKEAGDHSMSQERINALLIDYAKRGKRVARLKGGDPFIFGRGGEELQALRLHSIPCTVVPGISAGLAAGAGAGIPLTHRGLSQSVTLATAHFAGDDSHDWNALARSNHTVVFYMGVGNLPSIVAKLRAAGAPGTRPVAIVQEATLPGERVLRGMLSTIQALASEAGISPPAVLIVGEVAALGDSTVLESLTSVERIVA